MIVAVVIALRDKVGVACLVVLGLLGERQRAISMFQNKAEADFPVALQLAAFKARSSIRRARHFSR
jgi:hypothetical protein